MPSHASTTKARPVWAEVVPGAHLALLTDDAEAGIEGRRLGLELRDTILILRPGPKASFIFLFRKPISENTVSEQVASTGTGAINVEACRIQGGRVQVSAGPVGGYHGSPTAYEKGTGAIYDNHGRWPPNVVIVHGPGCRSAGTKKVPASNAPGRSSRGEGERAIGFGPQAGSARTMPFYTDPNDYGMETVASWECEPGCPVPLLDGQSGELATRGNVGPTNRSTTTGFTRGGNGLPGLVNYKDVGGASRFFPQLKGESELADWIERLIAPSAPRTGA